MPSEKSEKIDQVKGWLRELTRWRQALHVVKDTGWKKGSKGLEWELSVDLYTERHKYHITAVDRENAKGYLGCTVSVRLPRPGECWRRGRDLPDGDLVRETWAAIKNCIIAYELVDPAPKETPVNTTFEVLAKALQGAFITADMIKYQEHWSIPDFAAKEPGDIPKKISRRVINHLYSVMQYVPMEMLPELLVSENPCVVEAAARRSRYRRYGGTIERLRLLVTKILNC